MPGPRQVGKTTLALQIAAQRNALYLDLEDAQDRAKLSDPYALFDFHEERLVILDEIHRAPQVFEALGLAALMDRLSVLSWLGAKLPRNAAGTWHIFVQSAAAA